MTIISNWHLPGKCCQTTTSVFFIPESIIKSCCEVQIWQSSYKKAPGRGWRHLIIGWRGGRQEADRLLPGKKGNKSFINMMNLLDAARHQQNTHLVLVMLGLLTTYSTTGDTKRLPLQSDNSNGNGALNYRISKDDSLTAILAIILWYSIVKCTYLVSYKFGNLTPCCWYLLISY